MTNEKFFKIVQEPVKYTGQLKDIANAYWKQLHILTIPVFLQWDPVAKKWKKIIRVQWKNLKTWKDVEQYFTEEYVISEKQRNQADAVGLAAIMDTSNFFVVDVDDAEKMEHQAPELWNALQNTPTLTVNTINGGTHFYFKKPEKVEISDKLLGAKFGFDIRAKGLIILPPTGTEEQHYTFLTTQDIASCPPVFKTILTSKQVSEEIEKQTKFLAQWNHLQDILEPYYIKGSRDAIVFAMAGVLRKNNVPLQTAEELFNSMLNKFKDEEKQQRITVLRRTYTLAPDQVQGWTGLKDILPQSVVEEISSIFRSWHLANEKYTIQDNCFFYKDERLSFFTARITGMICYHEPIGDVTYYVIEGTAADGTPLPKLEIPVDEFESMSWLSQWNVWGQSYASTTRAKDMLREAILLNTDFASLTVRSYYTQTGWTKEKNYITGRDMDTSNTDDDIIRILSSVYIPLDTQDIQRIQEGVSASMAIAKLNKELDGRYFIPVFLMPYLSILKSFWLPDPPPFIFFFQGPTGSFKTTIAKLLLGHFTTPENVNNLVFQFTDTANYLEKVSAYVKDMLFVLDDFHPTPNQQEQSNMEDTLQRLIRSFTNAGGRGRLTGTGDALARYTPQGMMLVTGENLLNIQSSISRTFIVDFATENINQELLTHIQEKQELLPYAMASWIRWVQEQWLNDDNFPKMLNNMRLQARSFFYSNIDEDDIKHTEALTRIKESYTYFAVCYKLMAQWLQDIGMSQQAVEAGIYPEDPDEDMLYLLDIIYTYIERTVDLMSQEDPVETFFSILNTAYLNKKIYVQNLNGESYMGSLVRARLLGWYDEQYFYFIPSEIWGLVTIERKRENTTFPITKSALWKMLVQQGVVIPEGSGNTLYTLPQFSMQVLRIPREKLPWKKEEGL